MGIKFHRTADVEWKRWQKGVGELVRGFLGGANHDRSKAGRFEVWLYGGEDDVD
jgi:hypothetical protein